MGVMDMHMYIHTDIYAHGYIHGCRALWMKCRVLLMEFRAILMECKALLIERRALLIEHMARLMEYRALLNVWIENRMDTGESH